MFSHRVFLALLVLQGWALARADAAPAPLKPLTAEQLAVFNGSAEDVLDKEVCVGTRKRVMLHCRDEMHYLTTNESFHQVWRPFISGLGGAYVGIGADQGFTFMAWARSEIGFMMDYDPLVVWVNLVHRALIKGSPDVPTFVSRYTKEGRAAGMEILLREYADHPQRARILAAYRTHAPAIGRYFADKLRRRWAVSHWLHRAEDYAHVRQLAQQGRIRVLKGDLLKDKSLRGVGAITHQLKIPIRVIYTSNAEEFWPYPKAFRENFAALLMDDKTVLLRTRHSSKYGPKIGQYVYVVQDGKHFQSKLQERKFRGLWVFMRDRQPVREGVFTIGPVDAVTAEQPVLTPPPRRRGTAKTTDPKPDAARPLENTGM